MSRATTSRHCQHLSRDFAWGTSAVDVRPPLHKPTTTKMMPSLYNKTYLYCVDTELGWGNRTYFTFFSVFNRPPYVGDVEVAVEVFFLLLFFLTSTLANLLLLYTLTTTQQFRSVMNYFICNLTIADMCFTLSCPFVAYVRMTGMWTLGNLACKMIFYVSFVCGFVTIWTLSLISIDRYTCIVHGIKYRISPTLAVVLIILVWLFTVITFSPLAIYFVVKECPFGQDTVSICTLGWPKTEGFPFVIGFTLLVVTSGFVIPVVILIFSHISIAIKFRKVRSACLQYGSRNPSTTTTTIAPVGKSLTPTVDLVSPVPVENITLNLRMRRNKRDLQVVHTLIYLIVLFFVMWTPIFVVFVLLTMDGVSDSMQVTTHCFLGAISVAYLNAIVNPLTYGLSLETLREQIKTIVFCKRSPVVPTRSVVDVANGPAASPEVNSRPRENRLKSRGAVSSVTSLT